MSVAQTSEVSVNPRPGVTFVVDSDRDSVAQSNVGVSVQALVEPSSEALPEASSSSSESPSSLPSLYTSSLDAIAKVWKAPRVDLTFDNLSFCVPSHSSVHADLPSLSKSILDFVSLAPLRARLRPANARCAANANTSLPALDRCTGRIKAGSLTLVLAPPGHGKSTLLKTLAGHNNKAQQLTGSLKWNNLTAADCAARGLSLNKLCAYVAQTEAHMPFLTVKETFEFAAQHAVADTSLLNSPEAHALNQQRVEWMIQVLGLKECENVIIGNALVRGVSGGQARRVSIGEAMITNARVLLLDEITNGLDANAALHIIHALKYYCKVSGATVVTALLQPTPEMFEQFDEVILLREGAIVYQGPRSDVLDYFASFGIRCPHDQDSADFLTEFLFDPLGVYTRNLKKEARRSSRASKIKRADSDLLHKHESVPQSHDDVDDDRSTSRVVFHDHPDDVLHSSPSVELVPTAPRVKGLVPLSRNKDVPLTTQQLVAAYRKSSQYQRIQADIHELSSFEPVPPPTFQSDPYTFTQFYRPYSHSFLFHTLSCVARQGKLMSRNKGLIFPRVFQAIFMGLVLGSLYWQIPHDGFFNRIGLCLFAAIFVSFGNMSEVPIAGAAKHVLHKHMDAGLYPALSATLAIVLVHFPLAILECTLFCTILYFMAGFVSTGANWIFFVFVVLSINLCMSTMFRCFSYMTRNQDVAMALAGPVTAIALLFGGFIITHDKIPDWLIWLYWLSPHSWALRSLSQNEFKTSDYSTLLPPTNIPQGDLYLSVFQIYVNPSWQWLGIAFLLGSFVFYFLFGTLLLIVQRSQLSTGTKRIPSEEPTPAVPSTTVEVAPASDDEQLSLDVELQRERELENTRRLKLKAASAASALPFEPMDLSWHNIDYFVTVTGADKKSVEKQLLRNVSGFAKAGQLTALMGSSGAGKTTLLDVVAGRKTVGRINGTVRVNGMSNENNMFRRLFGYCEQSDVHLGTQTVQEALEFSAALRLPPTITPAQRQEFVKEIVHLLELDVLAHRIVGDVNIEGLSSGELKRLTIGVELVANPTILFLDEPTTGLDSRAALTVMRVIRNIANTGRAVVCTIHQPSAELFYLFDRLMLLSSGGNCVYFGPLGVEGNLLLSYFQSLHADMSDDVEVLPLTEHANPANWMLEVIGGSTSNKEKRVDYSLLYNKPDNHLFIENQEVLQRLEQPLSSSASSVVTSTYATLFVHQFWYVLKRLFSSYYRNTSMNCTRFGIMMFLGFLFGFIYLQIEDDDQPGINSKIAILLMANGFNGVVNTNVPLSHLLRDRTVWYREHSSHTYISFAYSLSLMIVELPYIFITTCSFLVPFYFMVGYEYDGNAFFQFVLVNFLNSVCFNTAGQFLSFLVPNVMVANILVGMMFSFLHLFGGIFIRTGSIARGWIWLYYLNPLAKSVLACAVSQYRCTSSHTHGCQLISVLEGDHVVTLTKSDYVKNYFETDMNFYWPYVGWLIFSAFVLRLGVMWAAHKINHTNR